MKYILYFFIFLIGSVSVIWFSMFASSENQLNFVDAFNPPGKESEVYKNILKGVESLSTDTLKLGLTVMTPLNGPDPTSGISFQGRCTKKPEDEKAIEQQLTTVLSSILKKINNIPEVRPYLKYFPFKMNNANLYLEYVLQNSKNVQENLNVIRSRLERTNYNDGRPSAYEIHLRVKEKDQFKTVYKNTYPNFSIPEEGLLPKVPRVKTTLQKPCSYFSPSTSPVSFDHEIGFVSFFKQYAQKIGYGITALCNVGEVFGHTPVSGGLFAQKNISLKDAQILAKKIYTDVYNWAITEATKRPGLKRRMGWAQNDNHSWLCFRVTFWDEYMNRVEEPYVAQILCEDDIIRYYTADENQYLKEFCAEKIPIIEKK